MILKKLSQSEFPLKIVEDLGTDKSKGYKRFAIFECPVCRNDFKTCVNDVKQKKSLQCRKCASSKHGMARTRLYRIYINIKTRCYNKNSTFYSIYGGRGINMCKEWLHSKKAFLKWSLENGYRDNLQIDRIDNNKGYYPLNCRWADSSTQNSNKRKQKGTINKYIGVQRDSRDGYFYASITFKYVSTFIGRFNTAQEAAAARDEYIINNNLPHTLNINGKFTVIDLRDKI